MIKKWSYSRWSCYKQCPSQYEYRYILKLDTFKPSKAMERGLKIHKLAEDYVQGKIKKLPFELYNFEHEFKLLRRNFKKNKGMVEPDISMTSNLKPSTRKKSDWFVGFADYFEKDKEELFTIDYKTGRWYPTHRAQGHAYSTALLAMNPKIYSSNVEFWYLDDKNNDTNVTDFNYNQDELPKMLKLWNKRIDAMYADTKFIKSPHQFCGGCARNIKNGGDCSG